MGPLAELLLLLCVLYGGSCEDSAIIVPGEEGGQAVLPCNTMAVNATSVTWFMVNPRVEVLSCDKEGSSNPKYSRLNGSSLLILDLRLQDEGFYGCKVCSEMADPPAHIQLKIASGPHNITFQISPTNILPNGTHYTSRGSQLNFSCSSYSSPEPTNTIAFHVGNQSELFDSQNTSMLNFSLTNVAPNYQGNYTCTVVNPLSKKTRDYTIPLLVYHPPAYAMGCSVNYTGVPSQFSLTCYWLGGYPAPQLQWENDGKILSNGTLDTLLVTLNSSEYTDKPKPTCKGQHTITNEIKVDTCNVHLGYPNLQSHALRTCIKGENVTLSCSVFGANPPAVITWLRNVSNPNVEVRSGAKYQIVQIGNDSFLTIVNCSKEEDEGNYICKSENGVATKEIYIWLDVTTPHNIVGLVSAIMILFLVVVALITGTVLYCDPQIYIKANPFRKGESEVLVLVESEEEEEMQQVGDSVVNTPYTDAEPSTPAVANGNIYKHEVLFHSPPDSM
ncbi:hypothetical protein GDO81_002419 [Engystomops pustulosus]|uniref:Ig-like domain-containing protein n=1 Tax=Engystomops pustulosus TaxID=76066 RepID=A0AAV7DK38_ENGPU|nr:hypothetical protein GDO81_002419 [Engystomops pustulosus]